MLHNHWTWTCFDAFQPVYCLCFSGWGHSACVLFFPPADQTDTGCTSSGWRSRRQINKAAHSSYLAQLWLAASVTQHAPVVNPAESGEQGTRGTCSRQVVTNHHSSAHRRYNAHSSRWGSIWMCQAHRPRAFNKLLGFPDAALSHLVWSHH